MKNLQTYEQFINEQLNKSSLALEILKEIPKLNFEIDHSYGGIFNKKSYDKYESLPESEGLAIEIHDKNKILMLDDEDALKKDSNNSFFVTVWINYELGSRNEFKSKSEMIKIVKNAEKIIKSKKWLNLKDLEVEFNKAKLSKFKKLPRS